MSNNSFLTNIISNLLDFKNSETLKLANDGINKGHDVLDKLNEQHHIEPMTIDDLLNKFSPIIDEQISLEMKKYPNLKPIEGEFKLSIEPHSNNVLAVWEFYFIDNHQQYKKINSQKVFDKDFFTAEDYTKIQNTSPTFKIESP